MLDGLINHFRTKEIDCDEMPLASLDAIRLDADEKLTNFEK